MQKPTIGRIVNYRMPDKNPEDPIAHYPAIITMTTETWADLPHPNKPPVLSGESNVHLLVFTAHGMVAAWDVPLGTAPDTWRWPVMA